MSSRVLKNADNQITCKYNGVTHKGVDVVKYKSETCPIIAHTAGKVIWLQTGQKNNTKAKGNATYGNAVKLKHNDGYRTLYAHMAKVYVKEGQWVEKGQEIGYMGNTGKSYGAHLHFEVRNTLDVRINPTPYLDANLPKTKAYYQVYDNVKNKWLPIVVIGSKDYAGNRKHGISGFRTEEAEEYRAYDMIKKKWLPPVKSFGDYAGNVTNNIGAIAIKSKNLKYRVHVKERNKWLGWITGYDINDFDKGFAGNKNEVIDEIQVAYK